MKKYKSQEKERDFYRSKTRRDADKVSIKKKRKLNLKR